MSLHPGTKFRNKKTGKRGMILEVSGNEVLIRLSGRERWVNKARFENANSIVGGSGTPTKMKEKKTGVVEGTFKPTREWTMRKKHISSEIAKRHASALRRRGLGRTEVKVKGTEVWWRIKPGLLKKKSRR